MAVQKRNILGPPADAPSSGDGATSAQYDPTTGQRNTSFKASVPSHESLSTIGGLDSTLSRQRGSEGAYRSAQAQARGEKPGGTAGFAIASSDSLSTRDYNSSDAPNQGGFAKGVAGTDDLKTGGYKSSDAPGQSSGYGKAIG